MAAALLVAFGALVFQSVQISGRVLACYCQPQDRLAAITEPDRVTIVTGTIGPALADRTPVAVDAWFRGPMLADIVWVRGGTNSATSCHVPMNFGDRWLLVLHGGPIAPRADGLYSTNLCSPSGRLGTPEGDALLAEAMEIFGAPTPAESPGTEAASRPDLSPWLGEGILWIALAAGIGVLLLGGLALLARRRPSV